MIIGSVTAPGKGKTDELLSALAKYLEPEIRLAGIVQTNTDRPGCVGCDMDVRVLPSGETLRISQALGPEASGCRLDAPVLEEAVGLVEVAMANRAELLILNKFGKHEASGRGFRPVIGNALAAGIPVLLGLNETNRTAFREYAGEFSEPVEPEFDAVVAWVRRVVTALAS